MLALSFALFAVAIASVLPPGGDVGGGDEPPLFLVVAPDALAPELGRFVEAKREGGFDARAVTLESILEADVDAADHPEAVKRYLYARWHEDGLRYVLLVGDADVFPVRYMVLDRKAEAAFDYAFYPSDLYYADLAKADGSFESWNAEAEGFHARYFGEVRGAKNKDGPINYDRIDYRPEVALGRWPVSDVETLRKVIGKSLAYERRVGAMRSGKPHAAFVHVEGWVDTRDRMRELAGRMPGWSPHFLFSPNDDGGSRGSEPSDEEHLVECLNRGVSLVFHTGHGSSGEWEGCFSKESIAKLRNAHLPAVVLSAGCSTAYFAALAPYDGYVDVDGEVHDGTNAGQVFTAPPPPPAPYQSGEHNRPGLGEDLLRADRTGAVAYFGCNTGSQPCGLRLLDGFAAAIGAEPEPRLGDCWKHAVAAYWDDEGLADLVPTKSWYPPSRFFQGMKFMLFGDPTLPLPRAEPRGQ